MSEVHMHYLKNKTVSFKDLSPFSSVICRFDEAESSDKHGLLLCLWAQFLYKSSLGLLRTFPAPRERLCSGFKPISQVWTSGFKPTSQVWTCDGLMTRAPRIAEISVAEP